MPTFHFGPQPARVGGQSYMKTSRTKLAKVYMGAPTFLWVARLIK
ncbi:hypothetical protein HMPREF0305_10154 [Corynebacterium pseudogenitalium ATCC 33035]|uniref:Uncharacterized protein n=1 Tax=Corynebacterium pseudogenitalium ATCC 33035 TaxID=525264 RepID=E2S0V2_9CORY|nr:hypothetical protein HMPREF0305_10154 [Corynebacterium pseudogenitalium ATCC 33035]